MRRPSKRRLQIVGGSDFVEVEIPRAIYDNGWKVFHDRAWPAVLKQIAYANKTLEEIAFNVYLQGLNDGYETRIVMGQRQHEEPDYSI